MPPTSLYDALATLPDPRGRQGLFHPLPAVMGLLVLATLSGRTSVMRPENWARW